MNDDMKAKRGHMEVLILFVNMPDTTSHERKLRLVTHVYCKP